MKRTMIIVILCFIVMFSLANCTSTVNTKQLTFGQQVCQENGGLSHVKIRGKSNPDFYCINGAHFNLGVMLNTPSQR